jgi:hypothetical protein
MVSFITDYDAIVYSYLFTCNWKLCTAPQPQVTIQMFIFSGSAGQTGYPKMVSGLGLTST